MAAALLERCGAEQLRGDRAVDPAQAGGHPFGAGRAAQAVDEVERHDLVVGVPRLAGFVEAADEGLPHAGGEQPPGTPPAAGRWRSAPGRTATTAGPRPRAGPRCVGTP